MQGIFILSVLIAASSAKWKPDPIPIGEGNATLFDTVPIVIQARKMARLMKNQDVVTTCRYVLFKLPLTFPQADAACADLSWPITNTGIGMATVQNENENNDIKSLMRLAFGLVFNNKKPYSYGNWVIIGLSKRINNDRPLTAQERGVFKMEEWFYDQGVPSKYGKFHNDMPDQQAKGKKNKKEYQVIAQINRRGYWDDTYASKSLPYVCQYCGKYIVLSKHVTWDKAKGHCEDVGLEFAIVNSANENRELLFAAQMTLGEELGGRRFNNSNWVWIGEEEVMSDAGVGTGEWRHYTGDAIEFEPRWDRKRQPDNWILRDREQAAVSVSRKDGKWDDSFKHKKRPFACMCNKHTCEFE